ncbi:MAG TPA: MYXO-CTERM sorting domain-containing protein, partial [Polyangiaceae bacterium]|nr:MYXO-CTERM sorting domain-containing protein [Polyangiaceae bacterium]
GDGGASAGETSTGKGGSANPGAGGDGQGGEGGTSADSSDDGGCSCNLADTRSSSNGVFALLGLAFTSLVRRRRRTSRAS